MVSDSDGALAEATSGDVHFCYFSSSIVLQHKDRRFLDNMIGEFSQALINGFRRRLEDINAVDAFFWNMPGNGVAQVRRVIAHTRNYVDLMPISSVWAGEKQESVRSYAAQFAAAALCGDAGRHPVRLNLHDYDVGHTRVDRPRGGKSVSLALFVAQWFRYPNARSSAFDKGHSLYALCKAAGGAFMTSAKAG